jgi:Zn-finger nucleic acid-binding protein
MKEMREGRVVVDLCAACEGLWLDAGELAAKGAKLPERLKRVTRKKGRSCPRCAKPLAAFDAGAVEIDACSVCGGLYLDRGELEQLVEQTKHEEGRAAAGSLGHDAKEVGENVGLWVCLEALSALLDAIL